MKDVADRAGVSIKTVSNVVNGAPNVSEATRARIQRVIAELGYQPNLSARQLRVGRTAIAMLGVPSLRQPYFAELTGTVIAAGKAAGLTVIVEETGGDPALETEVSNGLGSSLVSGVILSPLALSERALAGRRAALPIVFLGEHAETLGHDRVGFDNVAAAREAVAHLLAVGRRRVAVIGDESVARAGATVPRLRGAVAALAAAGLALPDELRPTTASYRRADGAAAMHRLLALPEPPDSVFCFNDLLALGAIRAAAERGVRVPEDVAVVGFDDIEEGRFSVPSLTTISPDKAETARSAVRLLRERMGGDGERQDVVTIVGHRLVVRESSVGREPDR